MENYVALLITLASIIAIILFTCCCKRLAYIENLDDMELSEVRIEDDQEESEQLIAPSTEDGEEMKESL